MSLWEYANPVKFLKLSDKVLPFFVGFSIIGLSIGLFWGFFFTPDDYRQGSTVKIIYLHVPSALMAINAWFTSALFGIGSVSQTSKTILIILFGDLCKLL